MKPDEIQSLVRSTWDNTKPEHRRAQLGQIRKTIPADQLEWFDAMCDLVRSGVEDDDSSIVVLLVHGIRTDAAWHALVRKQLLGHANVNVRSIGYGWFGILRFWGPFRGKPIKAVADDINDARAQEPKAQFIVIAHSFGTYVIAKILQQHPKIRFSRVIFCGSVVPRDYPWSSIANNLSAADVVNDIGTGDNLPIVAQCTTWGYGSAGRLGFNQSRVTNRFFDCGHSGFFTAAHVDTYWKPFILSGQIVDSSWTTARPVTPWIWSVLGGALAVGKLAFWTSLVLIGLMLWAFVSAIAWAAHHLLA